MRFRVFKRIIYVPKGVLIIAGVLAAAVIIVVINLTDRKTLPELERETESAEKSVAEIVVTPVNGREIIDNGSDPAGATGQGGEPSTPEPTVDTRMAVHITGAVVNEGVYRLVPGSIVEDAVLLCGGLLPEADTYCINLAMKVNDGMRIHIPFTFSEDKRWLLDVGYASYQGSSASSGSDENGGNKLVNINTASVNELITLSGIGESTAREIISFREEHGRFETIEDIMNVPGIKDAKFNRIKKYITV